MCVCVLCMHVTFAHVWMRAELTLISEVSFYLSVPHIFKDRVSH